MEWTHNMCDECWAERNKHRPLRLPDVEETVCCFCGKPHKSGIYVRANQNDIWCQGVKGNHAADAAGE